MIAKLQKLQVLPVFLVFLSFSATVKADIIIVPNFSFEDTSSNVPGWDLEVTATSFDTIGDYTPFSGTYPGADGVTPLPGTAQGVRAGYVNLAGFEASSGTFTTAAGLAGAQPGNLYVLTVAVGKRLDVEVNDVRIDILLDGKSVASSTTDGANLANGTFTDLSTSFLALASGELKVRLSYSRTGLESNFESQVNFDNVRLESTAAPEPSSFAMLCIGAVGLLRCVRSRCRRPMMRRGQ